MPLWVPLLVIALVGGQALLWLGIYLVLRRRSRRLQQELVEKVKAAREVIALGPVPASYRGGTGRFSRVGGSGVAVLTDKRLIFKKLTGGEIEIPLAGITELREDKWYLGSYRAGRLHLIIRTDSANEAGFIFNDHAAWVAQLQSRTSASGPPPRP